MNSNRLSPNQREILSAQSSITGRQEYLLSTNGALEVSGSFSVTGGATSANQTNGQQLTQIVDAGGDAVTVTGGKLDVNAAFSPSGTQDVNITKIGGNSVTTTLPVSGTVATTQSGTWNVTNISGTISLPTGAATSSNQTSGSQKTRITDGVVDVGVTGSGELKVLESNSATIATNTANTVTSLAIIDDWDESDRAKVNLIVGQAGVAAGAGTTNAATQRVVLPTDQTAIPVTDNGGSLTVDVASLPLPTGASTSALQTTGNASLSSIDGKLSGTIMTSLATVPQADLPAAPLTNQKTVTTAGTRVQLQTNTLKVGVIVQALKSNGTALIYVGDSTVSNTTGFELQAGQSTSIGSSNTNAVWIDSDTNGAKVCWIGS